MRNSQMRRDPRAASLVPRRVRQMASAAPVFVAAMAIVMTSACRDITRLQQSNPGQLGPEIFAPENADLIVNSARGDFECAFNEYVVTSGLFVDELANAISYIASFDLDRRTITADSPYGFADCTFQQTPGVYTPLSIARASNDTAVAHLEGWTDEQVPDRSKLIGEASAYAGYSLVLLGESMCSAALNLGPEMTPAQLFAEAQTRFDTAIAAATRASDAQTLNFALLGRARTELDVGNSAAAATDAALIPPGFEMDIDHDATATRRQNLVWVHTQLALFSSVDTSIRNRYHTTHDPRIAIDSIGALGSDGVTRIVFPLKDADATSPQAVAKYAEAQLIIAENDANTGQLNQAVTIINAVRTAGGDTTTFAPSPLSQATVMAGIVEERRSALYLEGHRLGDIRRLGLPISPAAGAAYVAGGSYSDQSCFPLPNVERINNPNIGG
jgi:starch-binding outer membrane protein, SusD/RagB family